MSTWMVRPLVLPKQRLWRIAEIIPVFRQLGGWSKKSRGGGHRDP